MRLFAIVAILGILATGAGWYTHVLELADQTKSLKRELAAQQEGVKHLTETNHKLQSDHAARVADLNKRLASISDDSDCAHHVLNWGE